MRGARYMRLISWTLQSGSEHFCLKGQCHQILGYILGSIKLKQYFL
jgi:hypothetical protein